MNTKKIIDGLKFTLGMILFNPSTGEVLTKESLNDLDRTTYDACKGAIEILEQQRWIPCSERLPDKVSTYMTTVDYEKYGIAVGQRYYHGKYIGWEDDCVIAWKPLPQPYKAEGSDNNDTR